MQNVNGTTMPAVGPKSYTRDDAVIAAPIQSPSQYHNLPRCSLAYCHHVAGARIRRSTRSLYMCYDSQCSFSSSFIILSMPITEFVSYVHSSSNDSSSGFNFFFCALIWLLSLPLFNFKLRICRSRLLISSFVAVSIALSLISTTILAIAINLLSVSQ